MAFQSLPNTALLASALRRLLTALVLCTTAQLALAQTAPLFTSPLPVDGVVGVPYRHTFNASGSAPIAFSVAGTLPPGLAFNRMLEARSSHTATLLGNGKVLVAGGVVNVSSGGFFASAELFDPVTNTWSAAGSLATARGYHTATLLANGKVLVVGGLGVGPAAPPIRIASAELYDPATNTWSAAGSLATARAHHTATSLADGRVLVAGGSSNNANLPIASAELYDPATDTWSTAGNFLVERRDHAATLLPSGLVLLVGGGNNVAGSLSSVESYNPATNTWSTAASLATPRSRSTATLLGTGNVLVAGGFDQLGIGIVGSAEQYDPATNTWSAAGTLVTGRLNHTATLLANGLVLVAGGFNFSSSYLASAELYNPATNTWTATGRLAVARYFHQATRLNNGNVLVTAGLGTGDANIASAEIYDFGGETDAWYMPGIIFGTPTAAGTFPLTAQAANGTLPNATQQFSLLINATGTPVFSTSTTSFTYAPEMLTVTSAAQTLVITNTGNGFLNIAAPVISGPFAVSANNCTSILPAGFCTISVTFTPVAAGAVSGALTIFANDAVGQHVVTLAGTGVAPSTFAYITNEGSLDISVIDIANTSRVVMTIPLGAHPYGVAINAAATRVYVTNPSSNNLKVIDTSTNRVIATVNVGTFPNGVAVSPDGTRVYVANSSNTVSVIDAANNTIIASVTAGTTPNGIAVDPTGTRVYVSNNNSNNVSVINTVNNTVVATIPVGPGPQGVAVNRAGTRVYAAHGNGVAVIDPATNAVIATIVGVGNPISIAFDLFDNIYVSDPSGTNGHVHGIRSSDNTVFTSIQVGRLPIGLSFHPDRVQLYVANRLDNTVMEINTSLPAISATLTVGTAPNAFGNFIGTPPAALTVPGAPTIGAVTPGNSQATINFTAPNNNGGSVITGYTATCTTAASPTRTASGATSPITVTGMSNFTGYNCSVTAINIIGSSPASAAVSVVPLGAPTITSSGTATGTVNAPFSYQILTNTVTDSYGVIGALPNGVTLNNSAGLISGTPTQAGTFNATLMATNVGGTGTQALSVTIASAVLQYTVTPSAGANGSISPNTPQSVAPAATTTFTVTPNSGYVASVGGSCGGTLVGNTYTTTAINAACSVDASFVRLPVLSQVVSRKTHGIAGDFDVLVGVVPLISGAVNVEPRIIGSGHKIVFQFDAAVTSVGALSVVNAAAQTLPSSMSTIGNDVIVNLPSVPNNSRVLIALTGVNGSVGAATAIGFLVGDVNNTRSVNSSDISGVKARSGQTTTALNFMFDLNLSGAINSSDISAVKAQSGSVLQ